LSSLSQVHDYASLYKTLMEALGEYNETNAQMDLVLFEDAMKHVCRISRIISNPAGHALLVGVGGSGKQSLARLAAHICGFSTMMIVISGSYGLNSFREDLQKMYRKAGQKGEGVMFLFTDSQARAARAPCVTVPCLVCTLWLAAPRSSSASSALLRALCTLHLLHSCARKCSRCAA
jgi:P-loop containing dynein motor region D4